MDKRRNERREELPTPLRYCERCGFPTYKLHCKVRCDNCGHFLDCGDLDIPGQPPRLPPRG